MSYLGLDPNTPLLNTSTETFSGTGIDYQFTLARSIATASDIDVMIGSTLQRPFADYTATNTTLLFVTQPASGTNNITVTYRAGALNSLDLSVTVFQAGTVGSPGVVSLAANNTGIYWANATTMVASVAGSNRATFNGLAASTSTTSGALTVQGGIGVGGNINNSGIIKTTATTESFAVTSGALQIGGGAGIVGNLNVGGDITCVGDFTVNGTFTTTGTDSLEVADPFVFLANANPGDTFDTGVVSQYNDGATTRYTGYFRDITDARYKLFSNLTVKPTTVVDTLDPSFQYTDLVLANLSATGNVSGTYLIGNGFYLSGVTSDTTQIVNSGSKMSIPSPNGNIVGNVAATTITTIYSGGLNVFGQISTTGNILTPLTATISTGNVTAGSTISAVGNISSLANIDGANLVTGGLATVFGNVIGGNLRTAGQVSAGGNIQGQNLKTTGLISATGDVYATNVLVVTVLATGNIQGGNLLSDASIDAIGAITAASVSVTGNVTGANINGSGLASITGNVIGGNIITAGQIVSTKTGSATTGLSQIYLNGAGNNRIDFNINGTGAPTFTTRSTGTKITLYPNLGVAAADYALGVDAGVLWSGVPDSSGQFKWYGGTTQLAALSGTGALSALGNITGANLITAGLATVTGNITGGNLITAGLITATGTITGANITGANLITAGLATVTGNITGGNIISGGLATVTGNITGGNIITGGDVSATGAVSATANVIGGNINTAGLVSAGGLITATGNITGGNIGTSGLITSTGNIISAANIAGGNVLSTLLVQGSIISATANIFATANITATDAFLGARLSLSGNVISQIATTSNIAGGNLNTFGLVSATGNLTTAIGNLNAGNAIVSSLIQGTTISASGNVTGANLVTAGVVFSGAMVANSAIDTRVELNSVAGIVAVTIGGNSTQFLPSGQINLGGVSTIAGGTFTGSGFTAGSSQTDIFQNRGGAVTVQVGTGGTIASTWTFANSGALSAPGAISAVGNVTGGNLSGTSIVGTLTTAAQTNITSVGTLTSLAVTGNVTSGNLSGTSIVGTLTTAAQTNITSVGTLTSLAVTGNVTSGNLSGTSIVGTLTTAAQPNITSHGTLTSLTVSGVTTVNSGAAATAIVNGATTGVGNIGSSTVGFNTIFAKATSAQYADLAECYLADADYPPGTVVSFGGTQEVTVSQTNNDNRIAGVISTNPSYIMNSGLQGDHVVIVALTGRVPTRVLGPVRKGDMMVSAGYGLARAEAAPRMGTVIGKALADFTGTEGTIEVVVGKI